MANRITPEEEQLMHDLSAEGKTQKEIARELDVSQTTVNNHLNDPNYESTDADVQALSEEARKMSGLDELDGVNQVIHGEQSGGGGGGDVQESIEIPSGHGEVEDDNYNPLVQAIRNIGRGSSGDLLAKGKRAINEARDNYQHYMNNRQAFYNMLRGAGFDSNEAEAIAQAADINFSDEGPGYMGGGSGSEDAFAQDPMDKMMDEMMNMMRFQQMRMMMESMQSGMGGGSSKNGDGQPPDPERLIAWKSVKEAFSSGQDGGGEGEVKMARIPGPDGEFKQVPVQSTESLMPMMMMSMMGGGGDSTEEAVEIAKTMTDNQMGTEDVVNLAQTIAGDDSEGKEELYRELMNEKMEKIEQQVGDTEEKSGLDFLNTIQEYEDVLAPMFGGGGDMGDKKEIMELQLENMDKFVDQRLRMLKELNEIEKQTEMADAFSSITEEGVGGLAQGLGMMFGDSVLNNNGGGGMGGMGDMMGSMGNMGGPAAGAQPQANPTGAQEDVEAQAQASEQVQEILNADNPSEVDDIASVQSDGPDTEELKNLTPQAIDKLAEEGEVDALEDLQRRIEARKRESEAS